MVMIQLLGTIVASVGLVVASMGWYNYWAYQQHCLNDHDPPTNATSPRMVVRPHWCQFGPTFNLYAYTQEKYWNVGYFRYYQWKQAPNFLLAAPILLLSTLAVITWIRASFQQYMTTAAARAKDDPAAKQKAFSFRWLPPGNHLIGWVVHALQSFAAPPTPAPHGTDHCSAHQRMAPEDALLGGPLLLGHYAVLAVTVLLGVVVAHIQISTRMICSTSPALYWYMTVQIASHDDHHPPVYGTVLLSYCWLYIVLGILLHSTWLPWT